MFSPKDFLSFDKMILPQIITVLFWILCILIVLGALFMIVQGAIIQGVLMIPFGLLYARIMCEAMLVIFKINENVAKIANKQ